MILRGKVIIDILLTCLLVAVNASVSAQTITELQQADRLRIKTWIEPHEKIVASQQVKLQIEISTDKWFSGGTRISRFEVKDAIVLQREKFALNSTRNEGDKTWTVQQWTLVVYPQRGGEFNIPQVPVRISVAGDNLEAITGELKTRALNFSAQIPDGMSDKHGWVATTRFKIEQSYNKSTADLKEGDALIRTIKMSADDLPAMMLPKVSVETIKGIAVYQKPPQVSDKVNRGDYTAERNEVITYVFEKPGSYQLPKQIFNWWNLATDSPDFIEVPALTLHVNSLAGQSNFEGDEQEILQQSRSDDIKQLLIYAGLSVFIFIAVWWAVFKFRKSISSCRHHKSMHPTEAVLRRQFEKACRVNDPEKALRFFYQWLDSYGSESFRGSIRQLLDGYKQPQLSKEFNTLMQSIYSHGEIENIELKEFANSFFKALKNEQRFNRQKRWTIELKLN